MMHIAWQCLGEVPYCFWRSSVKFQGHTAVKIVEFDPEWAFPDSNSSLNSPMATKCSTKLEDVRGVLLFLKVIRQISRSRGSKQSSNLTFPWQLPFSRIPLTSLQIPWKFPDLEKMNFSLTSFSLTRGNPVFHGCGPPVRGGIVIWLAWVLRALRAMLSTTPPLQPWYMVEHCEQ